MPRKRALSVQALAIVAVVMTSAGFAVSLRQLLAHDSVPQIVEAEPKPEAMPAVALPFNPEPVSTQDKLEGPKDVPPPTEPASLPQDEPFPPGSESPAKPSEPPPQTPVFVRPPAIEHNPLPPSIPASGSTQPEPPMTPTRILPSSSSLSGRPADPDPEAAADWFVEKTTKEANEAVKALTKEAEVLRARLQKVEAGLNRWQAVKTALESNGGHAVWKSKNPSHPKVTREAEPEILEPITSTEIPGPISRSHGRSEGPDKNGSPFDGDPAIAKPDAVAPPPLAPAPKQPQPILDKK